LTQFTWQQFEQQYKKVRPVTFSGVDDEMNKIKISFSHVRDSEQYTSHNHYLKKSLIQHSNGFE